MTIESGKDTGPWKIIPSFVSGLTVHILVGTDHSVYADALTRFWIFFEVKCPAVLSADAA